MIVRTHGWFATYIFWALFFGASIAIGMALMLGFLIPLYIWFLTDIWQWTPLNRLLRFSVLGAIVGVVAGAFFTTHTWQGETRASILRKIVTTAVIVILCIVIVVFAREWGGRLLPG